MKPFSEIVSILVFTLCAAVFAQSDYYALSKRLSGTDLETQIEAYKNLAAGSAKEQQVYLKVVQLFWLDSRAEEAVPWLLQDFPDEQARLNARYALLWLYLYQKNLQKALALVDSRFSSDKRIGIINQLARLFTEEKMTQQIRYMLQNEFSPREYALLTSFISFHKRDYNKFLSAIRERDDNYTIADVTGRAYLAVGNYEKATQLFRRALQASLTHQNLAEAGRFQVRLTRAAASRGDYEAARRHLEEAEKYLPFIYDLYLLADYEAVSGLVYYNLGDQGKSISATKRAIEIAESLGKQYFLIELYYNLGRASTLAEKYQQAFSAYNKSESLALVYNNLDKLFLVQLSQTSLLYNLSLYSLADIFSQDALQLAMMTENPNNIGLARGRAAGIQFGQKKYRRAITLTKQLLSAGVVLSPVERGYWNNMIGRSYMFLAQFDSARIYLNRALKNIQKSPQRRYYEGYYLENMVELEIEQKNFSAAQELMESFSIDFSDRQDSDLLVGHLLNSGIVYENLRDFEKAIATLKRGTEVAESSQGGFSIKEFKIGYLSKVYYLYNALARIYYKQYLSSTHVSLLDSVFYYEELSRSRVLKDALFGENVTPAVRSEGYEQACRELTQKQIFIRNTSTMSRDNEAWIDVLADIEFSKINLLQQKLLGQPDTLSGTPRASHVPDLKVLRSRSKKDNLGILFYHLDEYENYVLAVLADTILAVPLTVKTKKLRAQVDSLMQPFFSMTGASSRKTEFRAAIAYRLYQELFAPVEGAVELPQSIMIVPGYSLAGLPFDMLLTKPPDRPIYLPEDSPDYSDDYLLNKFSIFYSPTSQVLDLPPKSTGKRSLVVFANPFTTTNVDYDPELQLQERTGWSLMPLPFAEREADEIKRIYPSATVYKQEQATEMQLKKVIHDFDILHVASHAFVDTMFDDFSGLVLAVGDSANEDGILMGYEIKDLWLDIDLVVLSACETGRGGRIQGEGILGMPRLFLGAGARTILMSLWKVDDRFTSRLVPQFYYYLLKKGRSKAESLTLAKRTLLNNKSPYKGFYYQHPMFWASFAIYGDPGVVTTTGNKVALLLTLVAFIAVLTLLFLLRKKIRPLLSR